MTPSVKIVLQGVDKFSSTLKQASSGIDKFAKGAERGGRKMFMTVTAPVLAAGAASTKVFTGLEDDLARFEMATSATAEQMQRVEDRIRGVGEATRVTRFNQVEQAKALRALSEQGYNFEQSFEALPHLLDMMKVSTLDAAQAASLFDTVTDTYTGAGQDFKQINDLIARTAQLAGAPIKELSSGLLNLGLAANANDLQFRDVLEVLSLTGRSGAKLESVVSGLQMGLNSLNKPSAQALEVFERLNIRYEDLFDDQGKLISVTNALRVLNDRGAATTDFLLLFGARSGNAMEALSKQVSGLGEISQALDKADGYMKKFMDRLDATSLARFEEFRSGLVTLSVAFATGLLPVLIPMMRGLTKFFFLFSDLPVPMRKVVVVLLLILAAIGPVLIVVAKLAWAISFLMAKKMLFIAAIKGLGVALVALGKVLAFLVGSPIALFVAAILVWARVFNQLKSNWSELTEVFSDWKLLLRSILFFLQDIGKTMLKIAVPKWMQDIAGFASGLFSEKNPVASPTQTAVGLSGGNGAMQSNVKVSFDNLPKGARVERQSGDVQLDSYYGLGWVGG